MEKYGAQNVVSEFQGEHVGRLGWLAGKARPDLMESYRNFSSSLRHWTPDLDHELHRVFLWLSNNRYEMHHLVDRRDKRQHNDH